MLLNKEAITKALADLPDWHINGKGQLQRQFQFKNFIEAFAFMTQVALLAEKQDHHPNWSNAYHIVDVCLTSHDSGGLTQKDIHLASAINVLI